MPARKRRWVKVKALAVEEKAMIAAACERFIAESLKPRFLPVIRPTRVQLPVDIFGRWRKANIVLSRATVQAFPKMLGEEFDSAFTRLDHLEECVTETRFDVMWHRHTGQWWRSHLFRYTRRSITSDRDRGTSAPAEYENEKFHSRFDIEVLRGSRAKRFSRAARPIIAAVGCRSSSSRNACWLKVAGTEDYRTVLTGRGKAIGGECSCPAFEDRGFCKHMVATALAANAVGGDAEAEGTGTPARIRDHLKKKGIDALVEMIVDMAECDPALFRSPGFGRGGDPCR